MNKLFSKRLRELAFFSLRGCVNWLSHGIILVLEGQMTTSSFIEVLVAPNKNEKQLQKKLSLEVKTQFFLVLKVLNFHLISSSRKGI